MKKIILIILILVVFTATGCVDYATAADVQLEATPEPTPSQEPTVPLNDYERLQDEIEALEAHIDALESAESEAQELMDAYTAVDEALKQMELSIYRSAISEEGLNVFFGAIKKAVDKDTGEIELSVDVLNLENEKVESSLYTQEQIAEINQNLSFEYASKVTTKLVLNADTMLRYNGDSYVSLDSGFYAYLSDQIVQAEVAAQAEDAGDRGIILSGPVFIFAELEGNVLMMLEK